MLSRRSLVFAAIAANAAFAVPSWATETKPFDSKAFAEAQKAGKPIFVGVHASWCPTCKAQDPILGDLMAESQVQEPRLFRS